MSFKKELTDDDKKFIVNVIRMGLSEQDRLKKICDYFPKEIEEYSKSFDYKKYVEDDYQVKEKHEFLPMFTYFPFSSMNRALQSYLMNINGCIISMVKRKKNLKYE